jgi:hypothetical protein
MGAEHSSRFGPRAPAVSLCRAQVTAIERNAGAWQQREFRSGQSVVLENPSVTFSVDELYAGIELDAGG